MEPKDQQSSQRNTDDLYVGRLGHTLDFIQDHPEALDEVIQASGQNRYDDATVYKMLHDVMNLGMSLRQDQLNGHSSKSGNEILDEYWNKNKLNSSATPAAPEWLTDKCRSMVKELWGTPNTDNSNPRVKAIQLVQSFAKDAGYEVGIKKATELLKKYCL